MKPTVVEAQKYNKRQKKKWKRIYGYRSRSYRKTKIENLAPPPSPDFLLNRLGILQAHVQHMHI